MIFRDRTYSVLIVSSNEKFISSTSTLLPSSVYWPISHAKSAGEARRLTIENPYDIVLINTPLSDEYGNSLACDICQQNSSSALLFVKAENFDEIYNRVVDDGVMVIAKPTSSQMLNQTLKMMCASRERLRSMEAKQATVEAKIKEIRVINQAKWALIDKLKMTESEAHRYIEKQAMDMRLSKYEVAINVINTYGK